MMYIRKYRSFNEEIDIDDKISDAIKLLNTRPSVKYWWEPIFKDESYGFDEKSEPNSFDIQMRYGVYGGLRWESKNIIAYDEVGEIVGLFSIATEGKEVGAWKISVREDAKRKGWGFRLLDEAEKNGIDVIDSIKRNSFSSSGRSLMQSWLEKKRVN